MSPPTLTFNPTIRLASASKKARWSFQLTKYGPTSAASSARIKAIAKPKSVVCTMAPVQVLRATWRGQNKQNPDMDYDRQARPLPIDRPIIPLASLGGAGKSMSA